MALILSFKYHIEIVLGYYHCSFGKCSKFTGIQNPPSQIMRTAY